MRLSSCGKSGVAFVEKNASKDYSVKKERRRREKSQMETKRKCVEKILTG
jgi:hypothetical protein